MLRFQSISNSFNHYRHVRRGKRPFGESQAKARKRSIDKNYRQGVEVDTNLDLHLFFFCSRFQCIQKTLIYKFNENLCTIHQWIMPQKHVDQYIYERKKEINSLYKKKFTHSNFEFEILFETKQCNNNVFCNFHSSQNALLVDFR